MKIEKVNDNQFRCILSKEDLADRQIRISELAYGTQKAKDLFNDMIEQANYEIGFEVNDMPLMVEAIPTSSESIILVITKVEYPEELDTRFSRFSEPDEDAFLEQEEVPTEPEVQEGADDIVGKFRELSKEEAKEQPDTIKLFLFDKMEQIVTLAKILEDFYHGENELYKSLPDGRFYLVLHKSNHTPEEFNKVCNIAAEHGNKREYKGAIGAHLKEHGKNLIQANALKILASL